MQIVWEASRSAFHDAPELTGLDALQDVFVARAERKVEVSQTEHQRHCADNRNNEPQPCPCIIIQLAALAFL